MIKFNKPENLNGKELRDELNAVDISISYETGSVALDSEGFLLLDIDASKESEAQIIVQSHNGNIIPVEPTIADKLASVGLDFEELKAAILGGGN